MFVENNYDYTPRLNPIIVTMMNDKKGEKLKSTFQAISKIWEESGWKETMPVAFDETKNAIIMQLTPNQLRHMGSIYDIFTQIIYYDETHTVFDDYFNEYDLDYKTLDLNAFANDAENMIKNLPLTAIQVETPTTRMDSKPDSTVIRWLTTEGFQGALIGEFHEDRWPKAFLIENMEKLKEAGLTTLFLEFLGEEQQESIDRYLNSTVEGILPPPEVLALLLNRDREYHFSEDASYRDLLIAAKRHRIRVVGIENEASKQVGFDFRFGDSGPLRNLRHIGLHHVAKRIIDREKGDGKYVVLVGNGHVKNTAGTPGLSELLGVPAILLIDQPLFDGERIKQGFNVIRPFGKTTESYHAVFVRGKWIQIYSLHKNMDQYQAVAALRGRPEGSWLIREGITVPGTVVLVLKQEKGVVTQQKFRSKEHFINFMHKSLTLNPTLQLLAQNDPT